MNAKAEQRERSHEAILESASRLLRGKGIVGARVAEVMKGAGLTVGGFYAHFQSKEALVDAAFRKTAEEMRARLFARLDEKPEADRAEVILKRYLSAGNRDEVLDGCPLPAVVGEIGNSAPEHRPVLAEQIELLASELQAYLPAEGRVVPRRYLALGLVALMYGGLGMSRALRGSELSDEMLKACRALGRMVLRSDAEPSPGGKGKP
jgi:TetR/AcrR family transcriptional regulator, transcriptional repressor for nem operon